MAKNIKGIMKEMQQEICAYREEVRQYLKSVNTAPAAKPAEVKKDKRTINRELSDWTAKELDNLRVSAGLNTRQFTDAIGVSPVCLYHWRSKSGKLALHERSAKGVEALFAELCKKV